MGQYHKTVNLDKRQYINPHKLGDGLKLAEQCGWSPGGTNDALHLLLAVSNGRGGGDFQSDSPLIGSWGGDRIAVVGDYEEEGDLPGYKDAGRVYDLCEEWADVDPEWASVNGITKSDMFEDITDQLIPVLEREYEVVYAGDGWVNRVKLFDIEGCTGSHGIGDRMITFRNEAKESFEFPASQVREAVKQFYSGNKYRDEKMTLESLGLLAAQA